MIQTRTGEMSQGKPSGGTQEKESADRLKRHSDDAKKQAEEVGRKASDTAHEAGESLKQAGRQAADSIGETARQAGGQVRERASAVVAERKSQLAEEVGVFGKALHKAADTLDENEDLTLGRYAHQAGDLADSCAGYLKEASASEMVRGASNFTRRHPELVLGGLFLAGVSIARFLKASDKHQDRYDFDRGYGRGRGDMYGRSRGDAGYRDVGYETDDLSGYGEIGRYAGETSGAPSYTRNEDIPASTAPQPGSHPPLVADDAASIGGWKADSTRS